MIFLLALITILFAGWRIWRRLSYFLHVFQLEGYSRDDFSAWFRARVDKLFLRTSHVVGFVILLLGAVIFFLGGGRLMVGILLVLWSIAFASSRIYRRDQQKKPLAFTPRLKRLLVASSALALVPSVVGWLVWIDSPEHWTVLLFLAGMWISDFGAPYWVLLASRIMGPVERSIQEGFKRQARHTLQSRTDLTVVGITGSYGKTSTKFVVAELLSQRLNVLATPSSYNTPMGICIVVNNQLRAEHQVVVLEMGMRRTGDIRELCELARPDIAIVTSVGIAHMETMGSIEAIADEKAEIVRSLNPDGIAVLNADDDRVAAMRNLAPGAVWTVSVEGRPADIRAANISYGRKGSQFTVTDEEGNTADFTVPLLGRHNVLNVLLGVAVGRAMGLRLRQLAHAATRIQPVEHRLQLRSEGPVTIIDDAFNSNPVGARNAVEILGQFDSGRRIIVTPGMVELGELQEDENRALGAYMADHVDLVILVGERQTRPILEGLTSRSYPEEQIHVVGSLFEAQAFLKTFLRPGDVVLYENDLPDQYDEG